MIFCCACSQNRRMLKVSNTSRFSNNLVTEESPPPPPLEIAVLQHWVRAIGLISSTLLQSVVFETSIILYFFPFQRKGLRLKKFCEDIC